MTSDQTPANPAQTAPKRTRKRTVSARVRHAIKLRVENRLTGEEAARAAGLSPAGFWKAMKQPHVQEAMQAAKAAYIARSTEKRELLKAYAIEVAEQLLADDQPAQVRARMVEFLAGEPKPSASVAVQVNVDRGGYEYARPGAQVVEIIEADKQAPDYQSGDDADK